MARPHSGQWPGQVANEVVPAVNAETQATTPGAAYALDRLSEPRKVKQEH